MFGRRGIELLHLPSGGCVPKRFGDPAQECQATRHRAGLFDFSFMGAWDFVGPNACESLMRVQTRNLRRLSVGQIAYTLLLNEQGLVWIDATVWRLGEFEYRLFTGRPSDEALILEMANRWDGNAISRCGSDAILAVQGPASAQVIQRVLGPDAIEALTSLRYFNCRAWPFEGATLWLGRLGYTGELGYELIVPQSLGVHLWHRLLQAGADLGILECGFEAADTLRIEAGYVLFSRELTAPVEPSALGLSWLIDQVHLRASRRMAPSRQLVGLRLSDLKGSAHAQCARATVTSETRGSDALMPSAGAGSAIALAWVDARLGPGDIVYTMDGRRAVVERLPFYRPAKHRPRQQVRLR